MQSTPVSAAALIIACALALPSAMRAGAQSGENAAAGRPDSGWVVSPASAPAKRDFTLRILSDRYGSCQTSFSHQNLLVQDGRIAATFVIETDSQRVCIHDERPHGPAFVVQALEPGEYPVHVIEAPACAYRQPICPWLPPEMTAVLIDTLVVTSGTSLGAHPHRGARATGGRAHLSRGILHVSLPGDASGEGGALPHDLAGRRLPARPIPVPE